MDDALLQEYAAQSNAPETAVILVNWHGAEKTLTCLDAIARLEGPRPYVIVVENGSTDGSLERLRSCPIIDKLIESPVNLGFGAGCNLGIEFARTLKPLYLWHLNNDALPDPFALQALVAAAGTNPKIGAVGSVLYANEQCDEVECWGGGQIDFLTGQPRHLKTPGMPDYITGASLLCRMDAMLAMGCFDERYFLYWEDVDLCFRLRDAGWEIAVAAGSHVAHVPSSSADKVPQHAIRWYNCGAIQFFRTHAPHPMRPIIFNFMYRFFGQLHAGHLKNALTLLSVYWTCGILHQRWPENGARGGARAKQPV
jgi:GT2 family glycosyltransferase